MNCFSINWDIVRIFFPINIYKINTRRKKAGKNRFSPSNPTL